MNEVQMQEVISSVIDRTKSGEMQWSRVHPSYMDRLGTTNSKVEDAFMMSHKDRFLVVYVYEATSTFNVKGRYAGIAVVDSEFKRQYDFTEDERGRGSELWRLVRLVQRQVYMIDDFLNDLIKDEPTDKAT